MGGVTVEKFETCLPRYNSMLRPRGTLARALYNKYLSDEHLDTIDRNEWYRVNLKCIVPSVARIYHQLRPDEETDHFLETSRRLSNSVLTQIYHSLVKFILGFFMTQTSINGLLGRGSMFVFSTKQFSQLTGREEGNGGDLVDLGAGDGAMTRTMGKFFSSVTVTELSKPMRKLLRSAGFAVADVDNWFERKYDVVSCLNVLDRCERPKTLLGQIRAAMKPEGTAIVAVVLPFKPYVESVIISPQSGHTGATLSYHASIDSALSSV
ncbi:methyltransferase-like protein 9 isoform X2 [Cimex lectularius]|uniref:Methyltransferase-like protein 9 n=1 Tax=Cimex lectularius TaxID=79782 RepID=A0A8I6RGF2_CIMLE|nr:methyltransferase-like protein 9 isoform X2 [Cimex lectularius]